MKNSGSVSGTLINFTRAHKLEPVVMVCLTALLPFTAVAENVALVMGVRLGAEESTGTWQSLWELLASRSKIQALIDQL